MRMSDFSFLGRIKAHNLGSKRFGNTSVLDCAHTSLCGRFAKRLEF
jgi:hypothetical protein